MKNIIVGTAGHIDHGKTTLIKALTGIETDRLVEEKKRGITIELGFAYFDLPSGKRAGIVDVPGHEKFIKNMLAGVGGIDIVLLVVAADEGFMPQTQEHLDILSILDVKKGIIVLTKTDLVEPEWLELVEEEIKDKAKGTFFEKAPMVSVSSIKRQGIDELSSLIDHLTEETEAKNIETPFRMPIDRVFSITGFGTVVTGTQIEGTIHEGDAVTIYPQGIQTKVRNLQVHSKNVKTSYAGQRVAINLANVKKDDLSRGNVIAAPDSMKSTMMLDVKIDLLENFNRVLENRNRIRLYHGTSEILCRIVLLDRDELNPEEGCYAQLRLEEEIVGKRGDHIVIRSYSPMETIGGGIILEANPKKHKRFKEETLEALKIKEEGSEEQIVEEVIKRFSDQFENIRFFAMKTGVAEDVLNKIIEQLHKEEVVVIFPGNIIIHRNYMDQLEEDTIKALNNYHTKNSLKFGMGKEELRNKIVPQVKLKLYDELIDYFIQKGTIKKVHNYVALKNFDIKYTPEQEKIKNEMEKKYSEGGFNPPSVKEILKDAKDEKEHRQILYALLDMDQLVMLSEDILMDRKYYNKALEIVKKYILENGSITLSQLRDLIGTSRKYAVPLIEYLDQNKITKRVGEKRVLY